MIDWDRITELRNDIGSSDFEEVVEIFLSEVDETIGSLRPNSDADTLEKQMHFLKGCALNLGFTALAERCRLAEMLCARGLSDQVQIDKIAETHKESCIYFRDGILERFSI